MDNCSKQDSDGFLNLSERLALRPREAAATLGISERKLREIQHQIPRVVLGGVVLFPKHALEEWLQGAACVESDQFGPALADVMRSIKNDKLR